MKFIHTWNDDTDAKKDPKNNNEKCAYVSQQLNQNEKKTHWRIKTGTNEQANNI